MSENDNLFRQRLVQLQSVCVANNHESWFYQNMPLLEKLAARAPLRAASLVDKFIQEFSLQKQRTKNPESTSETLDYPVLKQRVESLMSGKITTKNSLVTALIGTHNLRRFPFAAAIATMDGYFKLTVLAGNTSEIEVALEYSISSWEILEFHPNTDLPMVLLDELNQHLVITAIFGKGKGNAKSIDYLAYKDYFHGKVPVYFYHFLHDWNLKIDLIAVTNGGCGVIGGYAILEEYLAFLDEFTILFFIERPAMEIVVGAALNTTAQLATLLSSPRYAMIRVFRINQDIFDKNPLGEAMIERVIEGLVNGLKLSHTEQTAGADFSDFVNLELEA